MAELNYLGIFAIVLIAGLVVGICCIAIQGALLSFNVFDVKSQLQSLVISCTFEPTDGAAKIILGETAYYCSVS